MLWSVGDLILLGRTYGLVADIAPRHCPRPVLLGVRPVLGAAAVIGPFAATQLLARSGPVGPWAGCGFACGLLAVAQPALRPFHIRH
ncbi:MAG: hypothetical protein ACRDWY_13935 [Actinomycetes bacterium]